MAKGLSKLEMLRYLYLHPDIDVRFIANVCESCTNPAKKIRGLYILVTRNIPVAVGPETLTYRSDDGTFHPLSDLELVS